MTYKQIVDRIKEVVFAHKMLVDFGYGGLTDIKTRSENSDNKGHDEEADYPYVFLNPTNHTRTGQAITYRFNMIVMEMAKNDSEVLQVQSNCQQYIDDILAQLRFGYKDQVDLTLNVGLTPFKERFQDTVAGMTATLEIVVPVRLNQCIAPFLPESSIYVEATHLFPQVLGPEPGENKTFQFTNEIVDIDNSWSVNRFTTQVDGVYDFEVNFSFQFQALEPGETFPNEPVLNYYPAGGGNETVPATETTGWPSNPQAGITYTVTQKWEAIARTAGSFEFVSFIDQVGTPETEMDIDAGARIKIYKYN